MCERERDCECVRGVDCGGVCERGCMCMGVGVCGNLSVMQRNQARGLPIALSLPCMLGHWTPTGTYRRGWVERVSS